MGVGIHIGLDQVLAATGGRVARAGAERFSAAVIDGREVPAGALFFAIKGPRFDGHDFAAQAVAAGADGVVVARGRAGSLGLSRATASVIEVEDPQAALTQLAEAHRLAQKGLEVVAVTGSNGKTTTKEMIAAILASAVGP